ncbi:hypothetical protein [Sinomicrobium sp. M5D2P9]
MKTIPVILFLSVIFPCFGVQAQNAMIHVEGREHTSLNREWQAIIAPWV